MRALARSEGLVAYRARLDACLLEAARVAQRALAHAEAWLHEVAEHGGPGVDSTSEAGARRFALTLGRALELALLIEQA